MKHQRPLVVIGTRPEAIKLAPVVRELRRQEDGVETIVCLTGQHRELLQGVVEDFEIGVDENLDLMRPDQSPLQFTARCLEAMDAPFAKHRPDCVVVQGDTATTMAAAMAAFYRRLPVIHVEAGLRTGDLQSPWPEEMQRRVITIAAAQHCAATRRAADNLLREGVPEANIHVTGNPVIDALQWTLRRVRRDVNINDAAFSIRSGAPVVLVTAHRRESFGQGLENILQAVGHLARKFPETDFIYPVHPNPRVELPVRRTLTGVRNIHLLPPVSYPNFVWLMDRSRLILTDSGGIQEEAPSLGKPVLVMRDTTERPEAVQCGAARLVGTSVEEIVRSASVLLRDETECARGQVFESPYGDGRAAERIVRVILGDAATQFPPKRAAEPLSLC